MAFGPLHTPRRSFAEPTEHYYLDEVEEVNQLLAEEIKADQRFDNLTKIEGNLIVAGIKKLFKRRKKGFKRWRFSLSNNNRKRQVLKAEIVPICTAIRPHDKDMAPLPVQKKSKEYCSWKTKKQQKQYNER